MICLNAREMRPTDRLVYRESPAIWEAKERRGLSMREQNSLRWAKKGGRREEWRSRVDKKNFITVRGRCVVTVIFFHFALGPTEFSYQVQGG